MQRMHEAREKKREAAITHSDAKLAASLKGANARHDAELNSAQSTFPARLAGIEQIRVGELRQLQTRSAGTQNDLLLKRERDFRNLQSEFDERVTHSRQQYQQGWGQLIRDWHGGLREIGVTADALCDALGRNCPSWSAMLAGWLESRACAIQSWSLEFKRDPLPENCLRADGCPALAPASCG